MQLELQGLQITSNGSLLLMRKLHHSLGSPLHLAAAPKDSRWGKVTTDPLMGRSANRSSNSWQYTGTSKTPTVWRSSRSGDSGLVTGLLTGREVSFADR